MGVFKENDIRGLYPQDWNSETAALIGRALPALFSGNNIVLGRDGRTSSAEIHQILLRALTSRGKDVLDLGVVDTPAVYFAVGSYGGDGGIMITASHNPPGYNGLKLMGRGGVPIEASTGLKKLEELVNHHEQLPPVPGDDLPRGRVTAPDITEAYLGHLTPFRPEARTLFPLFDCSNGSAGRFAPAIVGTLLPRGTLMNQEVDGTFPHHGPDPTKPENRESLKRTLLREGCDIGFCFDGDGDRVVMLDHLGEVVSPDLITAILGLYYFKLYPEQRRDRRKVLVDIRSSRSVKSFLENLGAEVVYCPVGHAKIKKQLREMEGLFAGELTGHYYFRDNYYCDSPWIALFMVLEVLEREGKSLADLKKRVLRFSYSGEISFPLTTDPDPLLGQILETYGDGELNTLDGYRFDYPQWWFIIRKSGTEPLIRLVVEAETDGLLRQKVRELTGLMKEPEAVG